MRVLVHSSAESDLDRIADWIAKDNPRAAARMVSKLYERISFLETDELAHMGRPGLVEGTRSLSNRLTSSFIESTRSEKSWSCYQSYMVREKEPKADEFP